MQSYVAMLRGINVGGRTRVAMADLRAAFEALGYEGVATYIQSGNVVFRAKAVDVDVLRRRIGEDLGVDAAVLVRTAEELAAVVAGNPFAARGLDPATLHVTFLAEARAELAVPPGEPDEAAVVGREVYLHCPAGYGRTKVNNAYIEKQLGVAATTRNWKTVRTLADMAAA